MQELLYDTFDYAAHQVVGTAHEALGWIDRSPLAGPDKHTLRTVIDRFPTVMFYRDDATLLDHLERRNEVTLPGWLRQVRQTLAGPVPGVRIRFDDFDHLGPLSDTRAEDGFLRMSYGDHFVGYTQDEQRGLFLDGAGCYPILSATNEVQYLLAASLIAPEDERVFGFCDEDVMDNVDDGEPGTDSVDPAFDSYPSMLAHIVECRLPDGTVVLARDLGA